VEALQNGEPHRGNLADPKVIPHELGECIDPVLGDRGDFLESIPDQKELPLRADLFWKRAQGLEECHRLRESRVRLGLDVRGRVRVRVRPRVRLRIRLRIRLRVGVGVRVGSAIACGR